MIRDINVKPLMAPAAWVLLTLGLACFTFVSVRAEEDSVPPAPGASESGKSNQISKSDAKELESLRAVLRHSHLFRCNDSIHLIGDLASYPYWTEVIPLASEQATAITKLDLLERKARDLSVRADADHPACDLASYQAYLARSNARRVEVFPHAQHFVSIGLLTEQQADFVTQRELTRRRPSHTLGDENIQKLLGFTKGQKEKLVQVWTEVSESTDEAAMGLLTPSQRDIWSRLTAERTLPAIPPNLPELSDAETTSTPIAELSLVFRKLAAKADTLDLSVDQKQLLKDLEELTQIGLLWINVRNCVDPNLHADVRKAEADRVSQMREEFLTHAEQVALLGILTLRQSDIVKFGC